MCRGLPRNVAAAILNLRPWWPNRSRWLPTFLERIFGEASVLELFNSQRTLSDVAWYLRVQIEFGTDEALLDWAAFLLRQRYHREGPSYHARVLAREQQSQAAHVTQAWTSAVFADAWKDVRLPCLQHVDLHLEQ